MYIGTFWGKFFSFRKIHNIFRSFRNWAAYLWILREKFLLALSKLHFPLLKKYFWWKKNKFVQKNAHLFWFLRLFFVFLPTMLRQACQNFVVHAQRNNSTSRYFGKLTLFSSFPDFEQKFSYVWRENFRRVVTTAFCVSRWRFFSFFEGKKRGKFFFAKNLHCYLFRTLNEEDPQCSCKHGYGRLIKKSLYMLRLTFLQVGFWKAYHFFVISGVPAKSFQSFDKKFLTGWSQLHCTCTEAQFEEKDFSFEKFTIFLVIYWNVSSKSVVFRTKLFGRVVAIAFSVARESFLMKEKFWSKNCNFIFLGIGESFSCFRRQFYGRLVKISLYMFRRRFWGEMAFRKVFHFFILSGIPTKSFQCFEENFSAGLSQLNSTYT